jgi:hypothetical protein
MGCLLLSAVGMTYRCFLLGSFGVNGFDLCEVNELLLAGLRNPTLLASS